MIVLLSIKSALASNCRHDRIDKGFRSKPNRRNLLTLEGARQRDMWVMNNSSARIVLVLCILCLVFFVAACGPKPSPSQVTTQDTALLLQSYRQAHEKHDLDALAKLYCDDGVPRAVRTVRLIEEGQYLALPIVKMSFNSMPRQPLNDVRNHGRIKRPNLAQVAELEVQLKGTQGQIVTRYYPVGRKDGLYLIID